MTASFLSVIKPLIGFWHWWSEEIINMIPYKLKDATSSRNHLDIHSYENMTVIEAVLDGKGTRLEENNILHDLDDDCWYDIVDLSEKLSPRLFLSENDIYSVDIKLPAKAVADPKSAIALQLSIYSPIDINQIEWACYKDSIDNEYLNMKLLLVKSTKLDQIEMLFADHGVMPPAIVSRINNNILSFRQPLIMKKRFFHDRHMQIRMASLLLLLTIPISTIFGANIIATNNHKRTTILESEVRPKLVARREAQSQENLRRNLIPLSGRKTIIPILEELAKLLPDSAWIQKVKYNNNNSINIELNVPNGLDVQSLVQQSKYLRSLQIIKSEEVETGTSLQTIELLLK